MGHDSGTRGDGRRAYVRLPPVLHAVCEVYVRCFGPSSYRGKCPWGSEASRVTYWQHILEEIASLQTWLEEAEVFASQCLEAWQEEEYQHGRPVVEQQGVSEQLGGRSVQWRDPSDLAQNELFEEEPASESAAEVEEEEEEAEEGGQ